MPTDRYPGARRSAHAETELQGLSDGLATLGLRNGSGEDLPVMRSPLQAVATRGDAVATHYIAWRRVATHPANAEDPVASGSLATAGPSEGS